ncbi:hypothetical protein BUE60_23435 [Pseudomonas syringae pv. actinidiae]|uniref:hypothetical protein n=1 Tax=Pseudomonas syringae TaxID=317 RepID=UPI000BDAD3DE|nr:hypothetical protein [Pseudomonas syringae]PBK48075.1 hypothetical protein BUE61_27155 [Pseudomonas syringae pv. actinidiae]PBK49800.1 hypothetical protein BUE60_23435 [Pseudomonas syringae pv. actinidiae]
MKSWEIIAKVYLEFLHTLVRKTLAEAYSWGARKNTPYKAWLAEVRRQLGHPLNTPRTDPANQQADMFGQRSR